MLLLENSVPSPLQVEPSQRLVSLRQQQGRGLSNKSQAISFTPVGKDPPGGGSGGYCQGRVCETERGTDRQTVVKGGEAVSAVSQPGTGRRDGIPAGRTGPAALPLRTAPGPGKKTSLPLEPRPRRP